MPRGRGISTTIVAAVLVVLVGGAGVVYYFLSPPLSGGSSSSASQFSSSTNSSSSTSNSSTSSSSSAPASTSSSPTSTQTAPTTSSTTSFTSQATQSNTACGTPSQGAATATVGMLSSFYFHPSTITVVIGVNNTVQWVNNDTSFEAHTVTANTPSQFNSGNMVHDAVFTCTFTVAGVYNYHCIYHPMAGVVIVKAPKCGCNFSRVFQSN